MSDDNDREPKRRRNSKPPSKYADAPYEIGKGKPPVHSQFQPGNKAGGRKQGSKNNSDLEKLLNTRVIVGEDKYGRPIRKTLREAIDRKLVQRALNDDIGAMRLIKEYEFKYAELERRYGERPPSTREMAKRVKEEVEKAEISAKSARNFASLLDLVAQLKGQGMLKIVDDRHILVKPGEAGDGDDEDPAEER